MLEDEEMNTCDECSVNKEDDSHDDSSESNLGGIIRKCCTKK